MQRVFCPAIELNPNYVRAILRRAELYEKVDKLDEALEDYKTVLEKDHSIVAAREACMVSGICFISTQTEITGCSFL